VNFSQSNNKIKIITKGTLNLSELSTFASTFGIKELSTYNLSGKIKFDSQINYNNNKNQIGDTKLELTLDKIKAKYEDYSLNNFSGQISADNSYFRTSKTCKFLTNRGKYTLSFSLKNWKNLLNKGGVRPILNFEVTSPNLDITKFLSETNSQTKENTNLEQSGNFNGFEGKYLLPLDFVGKIKFSKIKTGILEISSYYNQISYNKNKITFLGRGHLSKGSIEIKSTGYVKDMRDLEKLSSNFQLQLINIDMARLSKEAIKMDKFLSGKLNAKLKLNARGYKIEDILGSINGKGNISLKKGYYYLPGAAQKIAKKEKVKCSFKGNIKINKGKIILDNLKGKSKDGDIKLKGYVTLKGYINTEIEGRLSKTLSKKVPVPGGNSVRKLFYDSDKRISFGATLKGPYNKPKFKLNFNKLSDNLMDNLEDKAVDALKDLFGN